MTSRLMGAVGRRLKRVHLLFLSDPTDLWGMPHIRFSHVHFLGYVALVVAAVLRVPVVAGIALLSAAAIEASGVLLPQYRLRNRVEWRTGLDARARWRTLLLIVALATGGVPPSAIAAFASMALGVSMVSRAIRNPIFFLSSMNLLRPLGSLVVGAERLEEAGKLARRRDLSDLPLHTSLLSAGFLLTLSGPTDWISMPVAIGAGIGVVLAAMVLVGWTALKCRSLRPDLLLRHNDEVLAAFRDLDPEVICYFNGHPGSTYAVDVWLRTFESCGRRVALVYRHKSVESVDTSLLPGIVVQNEATVEKLVTPSTRIAVYPTNSTLNVHLQRDKRLSHVFIGHGDSDKAGSASPFTRSYDQVWVSGRAAIERYAEAGVKIPANRFVCVGRPPLSPKVRIAEAEHRARKYAEEGRHDPRSALTAELLDADGAEKPTTILYAPTWEGYFDDSDYSSVGRMGLEIIETLLDRFPDCRIVFKPHPMTGTRTAHLKEVSGRIEEALARAPVHNPSAAVHPGVDLHTWFDMTDLLITDVSSVASDFLAWDRPYVVTNPLGQSLEEFRRQFPTAAAAYVIEPKSPALAGIIAGALKHDPLRSRRLESKRLFLGDDERDPLDQFIEAVQALYESTEP